ncbi:hypothetical protein [Streptomyces sp. x-80]|uniref:hypothetical protein n=1 Tax=Streptomyces sp. x-80 TaxID=2789282 RepID=UPI00398060F0
MAPRSRPAHLAAAAVLSAGIALGAAGTAHADIDYSSSTGLDADWNQSGAQAWAPEANTTWHDESHVTLYD